MMCRVMYARWKKSNHSDPQEGKRNAAIFRDTVFISNVRKRGLLYKLSEVQ
jgi:hypothetical protein